MFRLVIVDRKRMKNEMDRIMSIENEEKRFYAIKNLPWKIKSVLGFWVPLIIFSIEIGVAILANSGIITIFIQHKQ